MIRLLLSVADQLRNYDVVKNGAADEPCNLKVFACSLERL